MTRVFHFNDANHGHSVRKLANSLRELGHTRVRLMGSQDSCGDGINAWFKKSDSPSDMFADLLANRLLTMGTRWFISGTWHTMAGIGGTASEELSIGIARFETKFSDLYNHEYGLV